MTMINNHTDLRSRIDDYHSGRISYTTDDLHQRALDINSIQKAIGFSDYNTGLMATEARRNTDLELKTPEAMEHRLAMIKLHFQAMLNNLKAEMQNSSFFKPGTDSKEHVQRIFQGLQKNELTETALERFNQHDDFTYKTSLPHAQDIIEDKLEEVARKKRIASLKGKVSPSQEYLIDKLTVGKTIRDTSKGEAITKEQMTELIDKAQKSLMDILANEALQISEPRFLNRETYSCRSATFQERIISVAGGVVALEYLKHNAELTEQFRNYLIEKHQIKTIPKQLTSIDTLTKDSPSSLSDEIAHLALAGGASFFTGRCSYLLHQIGGSTANLVTSYLDPDQTYQGAATLLKPAWQMTLTASKLADIPLELFKSLAFQGAAHIYYRLAGEPNHETQSVCAGLLQASCTGEESPFVSSIVSYATGKLNQQVQTRTDNKSIKKASQILSTNSALNSLATERLILSKPSRTTKNKKQIDKEKEIRRAREELTEEDLKQVEELKRAGEPTNLHLENLVEIAADPSRDLYFKHTNGLYRIYDRNTGEELDSFNNRDKAACWINRIKEMDICSHVYEALLRSLQIIAANNGTPLEQVDVIKAHDVRISGTKDSGKVIVDNSSANGMRVKHDKTAEGQAFEFGCGVHQDTTNSMTSHIYAVAEKLGININDHPELKDLVQFVENHQFERVPKNDHHKDTGFFNILGRKIDRFLGWCDSNGIELNVNLSKKVPLYSAPKTLNNDWIANNLLRERAELAELEQRQVNEQSQPVATNMPVQAIYEAPRINEESKQPDYQTAQDRHPDQYESNIPEWIRYGVNPNQSSLDPRERIEQNHAQLAALTTSIGKFFGGIWDAVRNWGSVPNPHQITATQKMEDIADKLVPYDRMHPNYQMLQTTSDILVDANGFMFMGGMGTGFSGGGLNANRFQQINPGRLEVPTQIAAKNLVEESAFLQRMNQPAWRSGIGTQKPMILTNEFKVIKPVELPKITDPNELKWFRDAGAKVGDLQIKYGARFDQFIKKTFKDQNLSEIQIRRILDHAGFGTYPRPKGLPKDCLVELSKENGGMIYRKPGTEEKHNILVRIMDGTREENIITATIEGKYLGHWRQQTPYVVQRRGADFLTRDGKWITKDDPALTHIPLEIFEFKGW